MLGGTKSVLYRRVVVVCVSVIACLTAVTLAGTSFPATRWFEDITKAAGINSKHTNREFKNPYAHIMAGYTALEASVVVADYDGDGFEDAFVTDSSIHGKNHLYHNNGNLMFTDVVELEGVADWHYE